MEVFDFFVFEGESVLVIFVGKGVFFVFKGDGYGKTTIRCSVAYRRPEKP